MNSILVRKVWAICAILSATGVETLALSSPSHLEKLILSGQVDSARNLSESALKKNPDSQEARFLAAKLSLDGKKSHRLFRGVADGKKKGPEHGESLYRTAQYFYAVGQYHMAIPYFRDYLRQYPEGDWMEPAHYWMSHACLIFAQANSPGKNDYIDSSRIYLEGLHKKITPGNYYHALAWEGLARTSLAQGDTAEALRSGRIALESAPDDARPALLLLLTRIEGPGSQAGSRLAALLRTQFPGAVETGLLPQQTQAPGASQPERVKDGPYVLQVGAFSQMENARNLETRLRDLGHQADIIRDLDGKRLYRVFVGGFPTRIDAETWAERHLSPQGWQALAIRR